MKRKLVLSLLCTLGAWQVTMAQNIGINGTGAAANNSALLDVSATDKGMLIPRVALTGTNDVTTVAGPAVSLLIYNTATAATVNPGYYYWNGTQWVALATGANWSLTGNLGTTAANYIGTGDNTALSIRTNAVSRIHVNPAGLVGIGTTNPSNQLQVNGDIRLGVDLPPGTGAFPGFGNFIHFSAGPAAGAYNSSNSDPMWMARFNVAQDQSELHMNLGDNCQAQDAFVVTTGGSGCAGNTTLFRFQADGVAQKAGGGTWAVLSDRRLKQDIQPFKDGIDILSQVNPVTFAYNGENNTPSQGTHYVGVIAQELATVAPDMVGTTKNGEYLTVDPSAFTYLLINSVQDQQTEIETLKADKQDLQAQMDALRADLEALKSHLQTEKP